MSAEPAQTTVFCGACDFLFPVLLDNLSDSFVLNKMHLPVIPFAVEAYRQQATPAHYSSLPELEHTTLRHENMLNGVWAAGG